MSEILLLDTNYLKRITQLNGQVQEDQLQSAIISAQDIHLQQWLGSDLLDAIKTKAQAGTLSGGYDTLVNTYVRKALAWLVLVDLLPTMHVQLRNGGLVINAPEGTISISPDELHRLREDARNKAEFYLKQMCRWLSHNNALVPEYLTDTQNRIKAKRPSYTQGFQISGGHFVSEIYSTK